MDELLSELQRVGFSQYEARAYVSLLMHAPVTGYELSKRSGIPRSMIYETLGKLIDRGAAHIVPTEPVTYSPVPARDFVARIRTRSDQTLQFLERELGAVEHAPEVEVIRHVRGDQHIVTEILTLVDQAESELWLALWAREIPALLDPVARAEKRGVRVVSVLFDDETSQLGRTFRTKFIAPEGVTSRLAGRLSIATRDTDEVVIAEFVEPAGSWALKTKDPALVHLATDYVRNDIVSTAVVTDYGADRFEALLRKNPDLSHVLTGAGRTAKPRRARRH